MILAYLKEMVGKKISAEIIKSQWRHRVIRPEAGTRLSRAW